MLLSLIFHRHPITAGTVYSWNWGWWRGTHSSWPFHRTGWDLLAWRWRCWMARNSQVRIFVEGWMHTKEFLCYYKNRYLLPWFCKHPWMLLISEIAHLVWAYPIMGSGSEWTLKTVIIVNSDSEPAAAAVLKINSSIICVSLGKQWKSKSNLFISFWLLACAQTSDIW